MSRFVLLSSLLEIGPVLLNGVAVDTKAIVILPMKALFGTATVVYLLQYFSESLS